MNAPHSEGKVKDKFEQLAADSEFSVGILANLATRDTEFVPWESVPLPADTARTFAERGLGFIGCVGLVKGQPRTALDVELAPDEISFIAAAFAAYMRKHMRWAMRPDMNVN